MQQMTCEVFEMDLAEGLHNQVLVLWIELHNEAYTSE